jgi:hypothetical protein
MDMQNSSAISETEAAKRKTTHLSAKLAFYGGLACLVSNISFAISDHFYQTSEGAIAGSITEILFLTCMLLVFLVIATAIVSFLVISVLHKTHKGYSLCLWGIIFAMLGLSLFMPAWGAIGPIGRKSMCLHHLESLGKLLQQYDKDYGKSTGESWDMSFSKFEGKGMLRCTRLKREQHDGVDYALNINVSEKRIKELPGDVVLLFESQNGTGLMGNRENMAKKNHGQPGCNILFGNGKARFVPEEELGNLRWNP